MVFEKNYGSSSAKFLLMAFDRVEVNYVTPSSTKNRLASSLNHGIIEEERKIYQLVVDKYSSDMCVPPLTCESWRTYLIAVVGYIPVDLLLDLKKETLTRPQSEVVLMSFSQHPD
jgi:hypothetical protein